ncbi:MAG: hypothetical protein ABSC11_15275, partial [Smithella sp.]
FENGDFQEEGATKKSAGAQRSAGLTRYVFIPFHAYFFLWACLASIVQAVDCRLMLDLSPAVYRNLKIPYVLVEYPIEQIS